MLPALGVILATVLIALAVNGLAPLESSVGILVYSQSDSLASEGTGVLFKEDNDGSTIGMADIILAKHRSGGTGRVRLRFQGQYARFTNPEFLTNEQVNNNMLPQNTGFDESGAPTMLIDSKINRKNDGLDFATGLPNDEPPF